MSETWGVLEWETWRQAPTTTGQLASESDVKQGRAVFYIKLSGGAWAEPYETELPFCAFLKTESGAKTPVVVIQAVSTERGVIAGYRRLAGGNGVCLLDELEWVREPDESFFRP